MSEGKEETPVKQHHEGWTPTQKVVWADAGGPGPKLELTDFQLPGEGTASFY